MKVTVVGKSRRAGRAPQGARGLKYPDILLYRRSLYRRAPQGARGLKFNPQACVSALLGRAPQGARGLKYYSHG